MNKSFCDTVITIPQTAGTCWFNALLMMIFYSQNSRKLLLQYNNFSDKNDELSIIFKSMLYKNYIKNPKIFKYLKYKSPQHILSLLNYYKKTTDGKLIVNDYSNNVHFYIHKFFDYLELEYLILDCFDLSSNKFYIGINEMVKIHYKVIKNNTVVYSIKFDNFLNNEIKKVFLKKFTDKIKNEIPKYLIINLSDQSSSYSKYIDDFPVLFNPFIFQDNIKDLNKLPNEINYKGYTYILDSCSLENYNEKIKLKHAICGITCKNKKYVYNGWMKYTNDIAMGGNLKVENLYPCELMPFDWNIHKSNDFCLNVAECKLDKAINPKNNLCFSFNKNSRSIIYVLKDKNFKSLDRNINSLSPIINIKNDDKKIKSDDKKIKSDDKKCPDDKIYNPETKRCVLKSGKIGKQLLGKDDKKCPDDKIYNPETKRCVLKSGKIGKLLLVKK